ncbi:uncharacterized protein [Glycine max]|uniref:uncharacterized protein n=1 Tax=Glycine max TaxID=3847 RepID=UPI0003DE81FA|nr:uncharacterized protein LOC102669130 [Glycine max]|eukprot:XP_006601563.1 uncharacterized protein LOC102669130 [Glycine max]
MGNQQRQGYNQGGFSGFQQGPYNQQGQWRSHPGNQFNKDQGGPSNRPPQQGPNFFQRTTKLEETLAQFMQVTMSNHKSTESALKNLEIQVGLLAKQLAEKSSSSFGANIEKNPKEECKVVMTRSRKLMAAEDKDIVALKEQVVLKDTTDKENDEMSLYSKFLKDMLTRKHKYIHQENIVVEGNRNAVIQKILPPKNKDPESVTIPCSISDVAVGKALIDLGASINLMPLSMCRRLGELEIMPTRMNLQLVDRSITRPYGVIEDVLVRVKHFTFPADYVVMDICEDNDIPLILGRPFMLTASCVVDMGRKKLEMGFEDQRISFDLFEEDKHVPDQNVCLQVKEVEKEVLKMASTKRKSTASRSQTQYDTRQFQSLEAWNKYTDSILGRNILPERNVQLYHTEFDEFKVELERRNLHKCLTNLQEGSIDVAVVKEFYANLYSPKDQSPKQARLRGHLIKIDADNLNEFLETLVVLEEGETLPTLDSAG